MADFLSKLTGTVSALWQIGLGGPRLKGATDGAVEARTSDDSRFAIARAADPMGPSDVATKSYVDVTVEDAVCKIETDPFRDSWPDCEGW